MTFVIILIAIVTALITFEVGSWNNVGSIRASAGLTLLSVIDLHLIHYFYPIDIDFFLTVIFGASFIGMSSKEKFGHISIAWAGFIYGVLFIYFLPLLEGLGGALGLTAFISVVIIHLIKEIIKNIKNLLFF